MNNTFGRPIIPDNEVERLAELRSLQHTIEYEEHGTFKHIAAMASRMFEVPIAIVNLVEEQFVITKAGFGMEGGTQIPREVSLCSLSILNDNVTVFTDAKTEPCLLANPLVHGSFGIQFYAAAPLKTRNGLNIGALCIVDIKPRNFSPLEQRILQNLASIVIDELERTVQESNE